MHDEQFHSDLGFEHPLEDSDLVEGMTYNESGEAVPGPDPTFDTVGHPEAEAYDWQWQGTQDGLCGPTSIAMVVNEFRPAGQMVTGGEVAQWAHTHSEMVPDGRPESSTNYGYVMSAQQISATLDHYGVANQVVSGGNEASLENYLRSGHQVILAVDGERIWHDVPASEDPGVADHALVLTGIDEKTGWAYLNDPGSPDGRMEAVPLTELMSAWSTSGDQAVVTDSEPGLDEGPGGFHESPGDLPEHHVVILPIVLDHELIRLMSEIG